MVKNFLQNQQIGLTGERLETLNRRKDGSFYPVEVTRIHLRVDEKKYYIAYIQDIIEMKKRRNSLIVP